MSTTVVTTENTVKLRAYGGIIEGVMNLTPFAADTPIEVLKKHFDKDGVIWIKGLISRDLVNKCRRDHLEFVNQGTNMLKPGTNPADGIFSGEDWRNFILPGGTRRALGLKDKGPFVEKVVQSHVASFYLNFKDQIAEQINPFIVINGGDMPPSAKMIPTWRSRATEGLSYHVSEDCFLQFEFQR